MKKNRTIQLKAIFLLIIFSLNNIIGFACAVGMDMGFNSKHHIHKGKAHHHHSGTHSHATKGHHHEIKVTGAPEKENCCTEDATQLSQSDKLLVNVIDAGIEMPVTLIALHFLYLSHFSSYKPEIKKIQEGRPYVLNARGIRVSIQSFQI